MSIKDYRNNDYSRTDLDSILIAQATIGDAASINKVASDASVTGRA